MFNWIKDNPIFFLLLFLAIAAPSLFFGALQVVFYIIIGIIILLFILSLIFRSRIARLQKQMEDQMGGHGANQAGGRYTWGGFSSGSQGARRQEETEQGDVKIFKQKGVGDKKVSKDVGDYVDFEEVDS